MTKKETVLKFFQVLNEQDLVEADNLLDPRAELFFPKTKPMVGKDRILKFLKIFFRQYPELIFTVVRVILQEDQAAVHWTNRGTSRRKEPKTRAQPSWKWKRGRSCISVIFSRTLENGRELLTINEGSIYNFFTAETQRSQRDRKSVV